jgi:hypothetical protein
VQGIFYLIIKTKTMKTIQKTIALSIAMFTATFAFAQISLGVTSTTPSAVNATVTNNAVLQTTNAASAATRAAVNTTTSRSIEITKSSVEGANKKVTTIVHATKTEVRQNAKVNAGMGADASSESQNTGHVGNNSVQIGTGAGSGADANLQMNANEVIHKVESNSTSAIAKLENKTAAVVESSKEVKASTTSDVRSGLVATSETVTNTKPSVSGKAEVKSESKATVTKQ